jgi:hypothetical protein
LRGVLCFVEIWEADEVVGNEGPNVFTAFYKIMTRLRDFVCCSVVEGNEPMGGWEKLI